MISSDPTSRITRVIDACGGSFFLGKVAVLDPLVAQQVAAGEVVDRPASVIKELSENALDAGATRVEVEIADGGRERMVVGDNGSGMSEEDAKLSVLSHATSKIRTAGDIESVVTCGRVEVGRQPLTGRAPWPADPHTETGSHEGATSPPRTCGDKDESCTRSNLLVGGASPPRPCMMVS